MKDQLGFAPFWGQTNSKYGQAAARTLVWAGRLLSVLISTKLEGRKIRRHDSLWWMFGGMSAGDQ